MAYTGLAAEPAIPAVDVWGIQSATLIAAKTGSVLVLLPGNAGGPDTSPVAF